MSAGAFSDIFADAAGGYAADLVRAAREHDAPSLARLAHRLRGSAAMYGFHQVSAAAGVLEASLTGVKTASEVKDSPHIADSALELARLCERAARREPSARR
ncbi:MAG TPA: Hpt domain-containing protein [Phycisphaerales bacterium]|nr:Hpt domain-containing protein [Phycisphaerales bacterium]